MMITSQDEQTEFDNNTSGVLGLFDIHKKTIIWGAGISGLTLAYELVKAGFEVEIREKKDRVGGKIQSTKSKYGLVESSANAVYATKEIEQWIELLGLKIQPSRLALKKYLRRQKKIFSKPFTHFELFKILIFLPFRLRQKIPTIHNHGLTVLDFFSPILGEKVTREVVGAALVGIYASSVEELSFEEVFCKNNFKLNPQDTYWKVILKLIKNLKTHQARSISFQEGLGELPKVLTQNLKENFKVELHLNYKDDLIEANFNHIFCTPSLEAASLIANINPELAELLRLIKYRSILSTTIFLKSPIKKLHHSFGLVESFDRSSNQQTILGILHNTAIFEARAQAGVWSYTIISKREGPQSHEALLTEFCQIFSIDFHEFKRNYFLSLEQTLWKEGIPILSPLHKNTRLEIVKLLEKNNQQQYLFFGNYTGNLSLREIILSAQQFTLQLKSKKIAIKS